MEPDAKELGAGHLRPTVIVGISDDEAGKSKEDIDGQIRVAYQTQGRVPINRIIEDVKDDEEKGPHYLSGHPKLQSVPFHCLSGRG